MADKSVCARELNTEFMFGLLNKRCGRSAEETKCEGAENVNAAAILRLILFFFARLFRLCAGVLWILDMADTIIAIKVAKV